MNTGFQAHYGDLDQRLRRIERELVRRPSGPSSVAVAAQSTGDFLGTQIPEAQVVFDDTGGHDHQAAGTAVPMAGDASGTNQAVVVTQASGQFTVPSAPTAVATRGLVSIGSGGFAGGANHFAGSANGTAIAVNTAVGSSARLIDLQVGGASKFFVGAGGVATVPTQMACNGLVLGRATKTGNYTLGASDFMIFGDATTGSFTVTLPTAASGIGEVYCVAKVDSSGNTVTLQANGVELIDGANTLVLAAQWASAMVISSGVFWKVIA